MTRAAIRVPAVLLVLATAACTGDQAPTFNPLPSPAATVATTDPRPSILIAGPSPSPRPAPQPGSSSVTLTGELKLRTTQDFQCSYARDDFFIRGYMGEYDGVPLYMSLNVEFYKGPGRYAGKTQILVRRISDTSSFLASWYNTKADGTVLPRGKGADVDRVVLQPEPGTNSTRSVTLEGHFGCDAPPKPGAG
jgi:hypothetical protein